MRRPSSGCMPACGRSM